MGEQVLFSFSANTNSNTNQNFVLTGLGFNYLPPIFRYD